MKHESIEVRALMWDGDSPAATREDGSTLYNARVLIDGRELVCANSVLIDMQGGSWARLVITCHPGDLKVTALTQNEWEDELYQLERDRQLEQEIERDREIMRGIETEGIDDGYR